MVRLTTKIIQSRSAGGYKDCQQCVRFGNGKLELDIFYHEIFFELEVSDFT